MFDPVHIELTTIVLTFGLTPVGVDLVVSMLQPIVYDPGSRGATQSKFAVVPTVFL